MANIKCPIHLSPIFVDRLWGGGDLLEGVITKNGGFSNHLGEIWLVVDRGQQQSVVIGGPLAGLTLNELWMQHRKEIFGLDVPVVESSRASKQFPLLVKLINAAQDLSLQVHPTEENCKVLKGAEPKTEIWYVIKHKKDAKIIAGFKHSKETEQPPSRGTDVQHPLVSYSTADKAQFFQLLESSPQELEKHLNIFESKVGDYFYIEAGTIHAIGGGNLILEVQQNSDTTYRVSDWGRIDSQGKSRELHIDESKTCIDFEKEVYHGNAVDMPNSGGLITPDNPYFVVASCTIRLGESMVVSTASNYEILSVVSSNILIKSEDNSEVTTLGMGSVYILPKGGLYTLHNKFTTDAQIVLYHHLED